MPKDSYERSDLWHFNVLCKFLFEEIEPCGFRPSSPEIVLFDCGANRGIWTRAFVEANPDTQISAHLFEPSAKNVAEIARLQSGFWPDAPQVRMRVNDLAVGAECGEMTLYADSEGSFQASLCADVVDHARHREVVRVTTLDHYVSEHGIERIDFLKLDLEGWELQALRGAEATLKRGAVSSIFFEFSVANAMTRTFFRDFWELLAPLGYDFFYLDRSRLRLLPVTAYENGKWEKFWGTHYFYCRHRDGLRRPGFQPLALTSLPDANTRSTDVRVTLRAIQLPGTPGFGHPSEFVVGTGWSREDEHWVSRRPATLQCWIPPARFLRLVFLNGPDCGRVAIEWQGQSHTVDLFAASPGTKHLVFTLDGRALL